MIDLTNLGEYDLVLADPPWTYDKTAFCNDYARDISFEMPYSTLTDDDIKQMKIPAKKDCILFLWAITPKLDIAFDVLKAWGFEYKSDAIWEKRPRGGLGHYFQNDHETLLLGKRGAAKCPRADERPSSVFIDKKRKHSQKPDLVYEMIESMYPGASKIELFARRRREGWTAWGNQVQTTMQKTLRSLPIES